MKTLVKMVFGSQLYGTATPESDTDYKGVFVPPYRDILLCRAARHISHHTGSDHVKNSPDDVDTEMFSLQYFVELACKGETVALDMLHAPDEMLLESSPTWSALRSHRKKFYTKNLKAFVGYARKQAAKYGVKGSRLAAARTVLETMKRMSLSNMDYRVLVMKKWFEDRSNLEHIHMHEDYVEVCGKKLLWKTSIREYIPTLERFVTNYGERARMAETSQGIDWKAVSHALRAAFQVKAILTGHEIVFPLPEAEYLREVKQGTIAFPRVQQHLEELMAELEHLTTTSSLPEHPDRDWWDKWVVATLEREYGTGQVWGGRDIVSGREGLDMSTSLGRER